MLRKLNLLLCIFLIINGCGEKTSEDSLRICPGGCKPKPVTPECKAQAENAKKCAETNEGAYLNVDAFYPCYLHLREPSGYESIFLVADLNSTNWNDCCTYANNCPI